MCYNRLGQEPSSPRPRTEKSHHRTTTCRSALRASQKKRLAVADAGCSFHQCTTYHHRTTTYRRKKKKKKKKKKKAWGDPRKF